jgi:hypothetical protein
MERINQNNYKLLFPWNELINKGLICLYSLEEKLMSLEASEEKQKLREAVREIAEKHQAINNKHMQISLLNREREFIYHDVEQLRGTKAEHCDIFSGSNIYDTIFSFPFGVVSWLDTSFNARNQIKAPEIRENFALFKNTANYTIVVEMHHEIYDIKGN